MRPTRKTSQVDVLIAYDRALNADADAKFNPRGALEAWQSLAAITGGNPYKAEAEKRAQEWAAYLLTKRAQEVFEAAVQSERSGRADPDGIAQAWAALAAIETDNPYREQAAERQASWAAYASSLRFNAQYAAAWSAEKDFRRSPYKVVAAWQALATAGGENPYAADAAVRASQWQTYLAQWQVDFNQIAKVLPLKVYTADEKAALLSSYQRAYSEFPVERIAPAGIRITVFNANHEPVLSRVSVVAARTSGRIAPEPREEWAKAQTQGTDIFLEPGEYLIRAQGTGDTFLEVPCKVLKFELTRVAVVFSTLILDGSTLEEEGRARVWQKGGDGRLRTVVTRLVRPGEMAALDLAAGEYRVSWLANGLENEDVNFKPFGGKIVLDREAKQTVRVAF
jgi:hypothetical protein